MNNPEVAKMWSSGKAAKNGRGNYHTDGVSLYSYAMLIGITLSNGDKIALNGYVPFRVSQTTSTHCRLASRVATRTIDPVTPPAYTTYGIGRMYGFSAELLADKRSF